MNMLSKALDRIKATLSRSDAEWKEEDHPRGEDGKFGSGGGGAAKEKSSKAAKPKAKKSNVLTPAMALKNKTWHEATWHNNTKAWDDAPIMVLEAIQKTGELNTVTTDPGTNSYYRRSSKTINMGYKPDPKDRKAVVIWRHEFGHAMDFNGEMEPQSLKCAKMMEYDARNQEAIVNSFYSMLMPRRKDDEWMESEGLLLADFVCALTNGREGWGHSKDYFSDVSNRTAEMFANYVALISGPDGDEYKAVLTKMAPATCLGFDGILLHMGDPKRYGKMRKS